MIDLKVYYEDNHLLVVEKPENMPTCLDESNDYDLLSLCKDYIKEKYGYEAITRAGKMQVDKNIKFKEEK